MKLLGKWLNKALTADVLEFSDPIPTSQIDGTPCLKQDARAAILTTACKSEQHRSPATQKFPQCFKKLKISIYPGFPVVNANSSQQINMAFPDWHCSS